jgi:hypothetical protein
VFLVGGASRIPLVATLLHRELGEAPVVIEQPELVVAEGSILADAAMLGAAPAAPGPTAELKLVSSGRADGPPARAAAPASASIPSGQQGPNGRQPAAGRPSAPLPGTNGLQPPVDPWPDADHGWVPDPDATVPTSRTFAVPRVPPKAEAAETQPISPASVSGSSPTAGKAAPRAPKKAPKTRPSEQKTEKSPRPKQAPRPKRRSGRFVRFLQILFSVLMMIVVPLAALVLAYGWGNGEPIRDDAVDLLNDLADLVGIHR